ncbi:MAG: anion transporter [Spirochaetales bacterium]|nr:anion transporter [Spirochaetales bacterium]
MLGLYIIIIIFTLIGVALGRVPFFKMNRASFALIGATSLILVGAISLEKAYLSIDANTLVLLFAMMVLNANLRLAGFFDSIAYKLTCWAGTPKQLLAVIIFSSGVLSAIFLNDTIVLMFTPLVIAITTSLKRNPVPYLIGLMTSANIGSAATLTGNPQNMIIGIASGIPYGAFASRLAPAAFAGLIISFIVILLLYPKEFRKERFQTPAECTVVIIKPLFYKSIAATSGLLIVLFLGAPIALSALGAAALLLFTRRVEPQKIFSEIDFTLLVFFSGLFVTTGAIEAIGLSDFFFNHFKSIAEAGPINLSAVSVLLSNLISNVPAVLLFKPLIGGFSSPVEAWLTLALSTTFAGNLTLLGSVANLIVAESAAKKGIRISFGEYLKAGVPITLLSLLAGMALLILWS